MTRRAGRLTPGAPTGWAGPPTLGAVTAWAFPLAIAVTAWGVLALDPADVGAQSPDRPRVHVIATGGTIAGQAQGGQLTGAQLISAVPQLDAVAAIEVEEFSRVGSSAISPDHWVRLSRRINALYASDPGLAGIVVTHGTDTMEETAYFLHLTVDDTRPVVMVGSMRNASAVSADGPANLLSGVRVAAAPSAAGHGVLVVLNDEIHSARDVRKSDNNRVDTFESAEWGALGIVDVDRIVFRRALVTRHTVTSELRLAADVTALPDVPIVADYAGSDGSLLDAAVGGSGRTAPADPVRAVVVQAFGGGRASPGMRRAVASAAERGTTVVLASRVPAGRVMGSSDAVATHILSAGDLPPHRARIVVMLGLLRGADAVELQRLLDTH